MVGTVIGCYDSVHDIQIIEDFNRSSSIIAPPRSQSEGHIMPRNAKPATTSNMCMNDGHSVCEYREERKCVSLAKFKGDAHQEENKKLSSDTIWHKKGLS